MLFYPAALPLSRQSLTYTAGIIRRHRRPARSQDEQGSAAAAALNGSRILNGFATIAA